MTGEHTDTREEELRRTFNDSALERLSRSEQAYYLTHGHYVPALADLVLLERRRAEKAEGERDALRDALREITLTPFGGSPEARDMQRIAARALVGDDTATKETP